MWQSRVAVASTVAVAVAADRTHVLAAVWVHCFAPQAMVFLHDIICTSVTILHINYIQVITPCLVDSKRHYMQLWRKEPFQVVFVQISFGLSNVIWMQSDTEHIINNQIKTTKNKIKSKKTQIYKYSSVIFVILPEVCARTYKLLGACSCVHSFKAEFFLRNKKQLICNFLNVNALSYRNFVNEPNYLSILPLIASSFPWHTEMKWRKNNEKYNKSQSHTTNCADVRRFAKNECLCSAPCNC